MYGLPILPFWNNFKNFTWSLRPSDSLPPVSPPFWRHIAKSDFLIFGNHISRDHISDLWTGISSVGSLNATFHCHCFTLFQCFSSFFSSPSQNSWFFAICISQDHMLVSCCTGKGLGMRFNWDNYEHDRVATFIILCLRSQTFYSWLQFTLYTATSTAAFAEP